MERPTKAQVDAALAIAEGKVAPWDVKVDAVYNMTDILAAEARALQAAIARVEALCSMNHADRLIRVGDIRAALRGDTP